MKLVQRTNFYAKWVKELIIHIVKDLKLLPSGI